MPGIVAIVTAISTDVVTALAAAGYPVLNPLQDGSAGKILLGRQRQFEQAAPNRIIFVPMGSSFGPKGPASASVVAANQAYSPEALAQIRQRSILTEFLNFEVRVWGNGTDVDNSFDLTQTYYQQVIRSVHNLCAGVYEATPGIWTDSRIQSSQLVVDGKEFVFGLKFATPVLDVLLQFAPSGVVPDITDTLTAQPGGTPEDGDC